MLLAAAKGSTAGFWAVLAVMLVSDAMDGWLARHLRLASELGRRLDSAGDYATMLALPVSTWWLWPDIVRAEAIWLACAFGAFFAPTVYALLRWRIVPGYHTWGAKGVAVLLSLGFVLRFAWGLTWPLHLAVIIQVLVAVEEFAIMRVLPRWSGSMPSLLHARRKRLETAI